MSIIFFIVGSVVLSTIAACIYPGDQDYKLWEKIMLGVIGGWLGNYLFSVILGFVNVLGIGWLISGVVGSFIVIFVYEKLIKRM